jgi:hypothetical protein
MSIAAILFYFFKEIIALIRMFLIKIEVNRSIAVIALNCRNIELLLS